MSRAKRTFGAFPFKHHVIRGIGFEPSEQMSWYYVIRGMDFESAEKEYWCIPI